jgi:threonine dehydrogenase-like Zn-dependent dehydrogenase/GT2 family glycosyltransferase
MTLGSPKISIIIRTYNEAKHLPALLDSLTKQKNQNFETIVVDSGSLDSSREIAKKFGAKVLRISSHDFTFGYSLNIGIKEAKGQFMILVSAHTLPCSEDWLDHLIRPFENEKCVMCYGRQLGVASSKFSEIEDFTRIFHEKRLTMEPSNFFANNANSAVRREFWEQNPFDELLSGLEDIDWAKYWVDQGYQVVYEPEAPLYHIHEESWQQVRRRYYREAVAARRIGIRSKLHALSELVCEAYYLSGDFVKAFFPGTNVAAERLSLVERIKEITLFRINKTYSTVRGLLEQHPMEKLKEMEIKSYLFDRTMQAVVINCSGNATLEEMEIPKVKPGDVLIRVAHVGVCATDLEIYNGSLGYYKNGMAKYPIVPGHEFSGYVVYKGQNIDHFAENDPVVVECIQSCGTCIECSSGNYIGCADRTELGVFKRNGAYANYVVVPGRFVHKIPNQLDIRKAALAEPVAVILKGLRRLSQLIQGEPSQNHCGVVGSGPLGHICAMILSHQGYNVTAFDRQEKRLAFFEGTNVTTSTDLSELKKCRVVVEITGDQKSLTQVLHVTPPGCSILLLGLPYENHPFSFETLAAYDKTVIGSVGSTAKDFEEALILLPELNLPNHLKHTLPLDKFKKAWEDSRRGDVLKVIIDVETKTA